MAATTSVSPSTPDDSAPWDGSPSRSRSRRESDQIDSQRARRRDRQRIKSKPANPLVINSILDSLDTLTPPPIITGEDRFSDTDSRSSRPRSPQGTINSLHSRAASPSPGFGVEYGAGLALDDEEGTTNAALPPTIRTSRPPSGLSNYSGQRRRASFSSAISRSPLRTPSISRRSSRTSLNQTYRTMSPNKLSSASWVKQNSTSQEAFETRWSEKSKDRSRGRRRSLRRINSQESLRSPRTDINFAPPAAPGADEEEDDGAAAPPPDISRAEQIIAKAQTPPIPASKRRLYLTDNGSEEYFKHVPPSPPEIQSASPPPSIRKSDHGTPVEAPIETPTKAETDPFGPPHRPSPRRENSIVDSIPMRTSSLRPAGSPRPGKRKDKKSKKSSSKSTKTDGKEKSVFASRDSKVIPEDSWADLGEDNETVKRIHELREQRKSRMLDTRAASMPAGALPTASKTETNQEPVPGPPKIEKENQQPQAPEAVSSAAPSPSEQASKRASRTTTARPPPNRAATLDTPSKALKLLGVTSDAVTNEANGMGSSISATNKPPPPAEFARQRKYSLDQSRPFVRPGTALSSTSTTPPLSLDYSYIDAVNVLQGSEGEVRRKEAPISKPSPLKTTYLDLVSADTPLRETSPNLTRRTSTKKQQNRWTLQHPDLPLELEKKKNRRKSTSDARPTREEVAEPMPRRDSVDIAVLQYLQHERLSRKLRHPQTGRIISYSEVGDPNGAAVFVCLGMGLTRYVSAFYDELATTLRLRLITIDRPGVGKSEPYPPSDRSGPLSWPDDILVVCQHLGIQKFSLLAHSAGAIYALASALIMPQMIQGKVHLLAPWIPPSQLTAVSHSAAAAPPVAALPRSQRFLRVLPTPFLKAANSSFMTATSASLKPNTKRTKSHNATLDTIHQDAISSYPAFNKRGPSTTARASETEGGVRPDFPRRESMMHMDQYMPSINPMEDFPIPLRSDGEESPDRRGSLIMSATATPMDPSFEYASAALDAAEHEEKQKKRDFQTRLTQCTWELATKDSNPATDLLVCLERNRDVGFRYTSVTREVVITHGSEDKRVPVANVKWLAEQMNRRARGEEDVRNTAASRESVGSTFAGRGGCEVRVLEGEGHGLMASPLIMGDVLTEIAGYWRGGRGLV